ncbi:MAG TPA: DUF4344 domain-containing metallopeptidase, partial [Pyrinomonadaceae bacterium]
NFVNLIIVLAILLPVTACFCRSDREDSEQNQPPVVNQSETPQAPLKSNPKTNTSETSSKKKDKGDFIVEHLAVDNPRYLEIDRQVKAEKLLEKAAVKLNQALILPTDLYLRTKDCGEVNALYNSNDQSVTVCYELMEHFYKVFKSAGASEEKAYDKMFAAVQFVFLHEIGHALIDQYNLPITANEEDAADRCSSYINIEELGDEGVRSVLAAADAFALESKDRSPDERNMADEHLLQEQRFYNSLCMIYGSNPTKYSNIVTDGYLPKDRAVRCPVEYERTVQSWVKLLGEWRKD